MSLEQYQHDLLPDAQQYIRLVKIHPAAKKDPLTVTIEAHRRNSAPGYTALSYTWGDKQLTKGISANGKLLLVTKNCWYALGQLRLNNICDYCWVDAICINQADDAEKSAQVNLMGSIYRNASLGAIAVGRHDSATEVLFRVLEGLGIARDFNATDISLDQIEPELLERLARGLVALGMHPYWNRIWIVQEFALAPKAILLCGNGSVSFDAITALTNSLKEDSRGSKPRLTTRYDRTMMESTPMSATMRLRRMIRESSEGLIPFERLLDLLGPRQCSDVRDRIFGMLSLVKWESNVEPLVADYSLSRTELAAKTLQLYKGHQLYAASHMGTPDAILSARKRSIRTCIFYQPGLQFPEYWSISPDY
ncbi:hypothetical protein PRZ48_003069 [Zasmidium cellare]|uniref:Heterokaryon incompatibility domain-containing protein n=1 Tax=Zasmidium cellare TaxID=395010 RepID=A0ABR0EV88_ZASCE|nr:hypothetical protein PRZ48_003069 [Zasmidium cellare]